MPDSTPSSAPAVPLLDLKAQYDRIRDEVEPAIRDVIESQMFILGRTVSDFESDIARYCDTDEAVGCASGSDAIMLALMGLGIGPGDEVICPSYTFFATGGYITRAGATPVFADIDPATYNLHPASVREVAGRCRNLKAIMPVHLYGRAADMDAMLAVGGELDVPIVEDAAQAIGSRDATGAPAGSRGAAGCFSFFPTKNLGGFGDGGMVTTNDHGLAERLRILRVHGGERRYYHQVIGVNSRLDALQAAVLRIKLKHLDRWTDERRDNARHYDQRFHRAGAVTSADDWVHADLPLATPAAPDAPARHIYNQYVIRVPAALRDGLRDHLRERNIGTEIYYPVPLHRQECFAYLGYEQGDLPATEAASRETVALPIYAELTREQLDHVAASIIAYVTEHSGATTGGHAGRTV